MPFFVQFQSFSFGVTVSLFCINTIFQGQLRDTLAREGRRRLLFREDGRWSKTGWVFGTLQCVHWMGSRWNVTKQNISRVFALAKILELESFCIVNWWDGNLAAVRAGAWCCDAELYGASHFPDKLLPYSITAVVCSLVTFITGALCGALLTVCMHQTTVLTCVYGQFLFTNLCYSGHNASLSTNWWGWG